jgi:hypothetical protein
MPIRVVNVSRLRGPAARSQVVYVGRPFAGWPGHELANPFKIGQRSPHNLRVQIDRDHALDLYRQFLDGMRDHGTLGDAIRRLWDATGGGAKPLGCWCVDAAAGDGSPVVCHAQILAEHLRRFGGLP